MVAMGKINLTKNAKLILKQRYLKKDSSGKIVETPEQLFRRVAKDIAKADALYPKQRRNVKQTEKKFYQLMASLDFLPNSPNLMNAGTKIQQLAACFVLPLEDNLDSIFQTLYKTALIHKSGGGTGFDFSSLRSKDDFILETAGKSSGPVSFIQVFDCATEQIKQGGRRRGANMAILRIDHPDIEDFITAKQRFPLSNFNLSVAVTNKFMKALTKKEAFYLVNPFTKKRIRKNPLKLFNLLCKSAWESGDPGVVFIDTINKNKSLPERISATNPCGEQPLLPFESCNLGSINLANHFKDNHIDWQKLKETVHSAVHFLDNAIDRSNYIFPEIEKITKKNRKIGLGVMGFADLLFQLEIPYNSPAAIKTAEETMKFISKEAKTASQVLAKIRGAFPNFRKSNLKEKQRNATLTTIAPTGTISLIAGCSSGIEPLFALAFSHQVLDSKEISEFNPLLLKYLRRKRLNKKAIVNKIKKEGTLKNTKGINSEVKKVFVTALEIAPEDHLKMQATFQKYTDNAVSKTINLYKSATVNEVKKIFLKAHELGCKGVTIYRYGSKKRQVLSFGIGKGKAKTKEKDKKKDKCPTCG